MKYDAFLQTQSSQVDRREYFAIPDPRAHSDSALMFSLSEPFTEGYKKIFHFLRQALFYITFVDSLLDIRQAAILTNTHVVKGLPPRVSPLIQQLQFGDELVCPIYITGLSFILLLS